MAITKIGVYRNPPEDMTDFEAISDLLMAYARDLGGQGMILTEWTNASGWPKLAMGSYIFHGGASYLVDTEDYEIGAPGNGTHYLRIAASGETLAVSWISSLTGYAWNPIYNGLYHADQSQILPYQLVVAGASREKWKITNLAQGGGYVVVNAKGMIEGNLFPTMKIDGTFTSNGTYIVPNYIRLFVACFGGGGGGGGGNSGEGQYSARNGGRGGKGGLQGNVSIKEIFPRAGDELTVIVGIGGSGGSGGPGGAVSSSWPGTDGNAGGSSHISNTDGLIICNASGGAGGEQGNSGTGHFENGNNGQIDLYNRFIYNITIPASMPCSGGDGGSGGKGSSPGPSGSGLGGSGYNGSGAGGNGGNSGIDGMNGINATGFANGGGGGGGGGDQYNNGRKGGNGGAGSNGIVYFIKA